MRLPAARGTRGSRPHLTAACCAAACALETGALPGRRDMRAATAKLARVWRRTARRLPWPTVAEHMSHLAPLRACMRLTRVQDVSPAAAHAQLDHDGCCLTDARALAADLCAGAPGRALLLESAPCVLLVKLADGVWAGAVAPGAPEPMLEFYKIASPAKVSAFIASAIKDGPCPAAELTRF